MIFIVGIKSKLTLYVYIYICMYVHIYIYIYTVYMYVCTYIYNVIFGYVDNGTLSVLLGHVILIEWLYWLMRQNGNSSRKSFIL